MITRTSISNWNGRGPAVRQGTLLCGVPLATVQIFLIAAITFPESSYAGKAYFQEILQDFDVTDAAGLNATLQNNKLFYSWSGTSVTLKDGKFVLNNAKPDLFLGSNADGKNTLNLTFDNSLGNGKFMLVMGDRDKPSVLDEDKSSLFSADNKNLTTRFTKTTVGLKGDPVIDITNISTDALSIDPSSVLAQVSNTMNPFDLSNNFVPDGTPVTTNLVSGSYNLLSGETAEFSFDLPPGATNWSFQEYYTSDGQTYMDLIADSVPEPTSLTLCVMALMTLLIRTRR